MQTFHVSALGFRANQKTGFFGELGLGYKGVVSAGLNAHFWAVSLPPLSLNSAGRSPYDREIEPGLHLYYNEFYQSSEERLS
jgi:hypothetical protein